MWTGALEARKGEPSWKEKRGHTFPGESLGVCSLQKNHPGTRQLARSSCSSRVGARGPFAACLPAGPKRLLTYLHRENERGASAGQVKSHPTSAHTICGRRPSRS